jgi:hypothetical protein
MNLLDLLDRNRRIARDDPIRQDKFLSVGFGGPMGQGFVEPNSYITFIIKYRLWWLPTAIEFKIIFKEARQNQNIPLLVLL